jgi:hypothetical protein
MRRCRFRSGWGLTIAVGLAGLVQATPALGQYAYYPGNRALRRTYGTYGPGMSFGEFGYRLNFGYAFGNPFGGLGNFGAGYGFGSGVGPGFGPGGSILYLPAYNTFSMGSAFAGFYPPWAAYGYGTQNPAIFGFPGPNYPGSGRAPRRPSYGYQVPGRFR